MTDFYKQIASLSSKYPGLWKSLDAIRAARGKNDVPTWDGRCFLPVAFSATFLQAMQQVDSRISPAPGDAELIVVLGGWRPSMDVYCFSPGLYDALVTTPIGKIPCEVLLRLPAWTVYIETPGARWVGKDTPGFWASLQDKNGHMALLVAVNIPDDGPLILVLDLEEEDLSQAILKGASKKILPEATTYPQWRQLEGGVNMMISLLLYICSTEPDIMGSQPGTAWPPSLPAPQKIKTGYRLFQADKPTIWTVGDTISRQILSHRDLANGHAPHAGPRPHIRRAHWHGFWSGPIKPREGQEAHPRRFELRWLPPIAVAMAEDETA